MSQPTAIHFGRLVQPIALSGRAVIKLANKAAMPGHHIYARLPAWPKAPRASSTAAAMLNMVTRTRKTTRRLELVGSVIRASRGTIFILYDPVGVLVPGYGFFQPSKCRMTYDTASPSSAHISSTQSSLVSGDCLH